MGSWVSGYLEVMLIEELWKDIKDYEGLYKISNMGNVYSCITNKLLKPSKNTHTKHLGVILRKNGKSKRFQIHRLVAEAFIPNPYNLPQVNHINEIQYDNRWFNLEWCTPQYNSKYSSHKLKGKRAWNKGISTGPLTYEHKLNISKGHIGNRLSNKTKQKISDSLKQYYKNKNLR